MLILFIIVIHQTHPTHYILYVRKLFKHLHGSDPAEAKDLYIRYDILDTRYKMPIGHVTQTGNVSIPKQWRDELGIEPNSSILIEKKDGKIVIEPLNKQELKDALKEVDEEAKRKNIKFTRKESVQDDLYN